MKLIKFLLLWIMVMTIIPLCTVVMADDCFDTIVDDEWNVFYIDPFDKLGVYEKRESLVSIYWDKIDCTWNKKVYSSDEYLEDVYGDIYNQYKRWKNEKSSTEAIIELIMWILSCIAMWRIFTKAWKSGIYSLIPIYNFYVLSDIAGLSRLFSKAVICLIAWIILYFFIPILWLLLLCAFWIFGLCVNFNVARNFGRSTISSVLYVIFNPIAMLILAFWKDKYYVTEQQENLKAMKAKMNAMDTEYTDTGVDTMVWLNTQPNNNLQKNSVETEVSIKYPDTSNFW